MEELEIILYIQRTFYCLITFLSFTFKTLIYKNYVAFSLRIDTYRNITLGKHRPPK